MAEGRPKQWTEAEKLGVLFQVIESAPIPWDSLELPEGRTKKAVQVMIDREKTRMKKAREAVAKADDDGNDTTKNEAAGKAKGKRKANGEAGDTPKKAKTPKKTKAKAGEDVEEKMKQEEEEQDEVEGVKAEPAEGED